MTSLPTKPNGASKPMDLSEHREIGYQDAMSAFDEEAYYAEKDREIPCPAAGGIPCVGDWCLEHQVCVDQYLDFKENL